MKIKNKKFVPLIILCFLFSLTVTSCGSAKPEKDIEENNTTTPDAEKDSSLPYSSLSEGDTAPDFSTVLTDGTGFTLSEQQGKIVLLNFWATWCGPCVREMPAFEKLHGEYGEDVVILAVNCMESEDIVKAFQEENSYTFPIACDPEGDVVLKYPSQGIPYTLVIDDKGTIRKIYVGAADAETQYLEYKGAIDAVSAEE